MFKDATLDLTYPRKLNNSTIEHEWLTEFPNIRYKRVCILSGANASGKTALGKALCMINNYLDGKSINQENSWLDIANLPENMLFKKKPALFSVEFVTPDTGDLHFLEAKFDRDELTEETYKAIRLHKNSPYTNESTRLQLSAPLSHYRKGKNDHGITNPGFTSVAHSTGNLKIIPAWRYQFSTKSLNDRYYLPSKNTKILKSFLCAFDPSIKNVTFIDKDSHRIEFYNKDTILIDGGKISKPDRLSRGTNEAIEIAMFYEDMRARRDQVISENTGNGKTYYLDEMLAYSHSEVEQSILNLLIETLPKNSQLFYTTHNYDILEMNLPAHSYTFLRKSKYSEFVQPEKMGHNQNDRSLLGYVKNDVFGTLPNLDPINDLLQ